MKNTEMVPFKVLSKAVHAQLRTMVSSGQLLEVNLERDDLFALYLKSFPESTNPIYKERTEHDCNCCKNFIRDVGRMVSIKNGEVVTVWDVAVGGGYQVVVDAIAKKVRETFILNVYTHWSQKVGTEKNVQDLGEGKTKTWDHFYGEVPKECVNITPTVLSEIASTVAVYKRGLEEIKDDAVDAVLELIDQNSLYRGAEFKASLLSFRDLKRKYASLKDDLTKDRFLWTSYKEHGARIRNTAIGTLLQDLSGDAEMDDAVKSFEAKVAPQNYKRPAPVITAKMVDQALKALRDDQLEDSLYRRYATIEDLSVNDILFADRGVRAAMKDNLAASLMSEVKEKSKDFSQVKSIGIEDFLANVLPSTTSVEVCLENGHEPNLVSLIAPKVAAAAGLFKWNNPFSWSYNGNVTDSIKERVKAAGGKVDGYMRVSLSWYNLDDLDLHVLEPNGAHIHFGAKLSPHTGGKLDVDMNAPGTAGSRSAVENVCWPDPKKMRAGTYAIMVHNFCKRESIDIGFEVEIECQGELHKISFPNAAGNKEEVQLCQVHFDGKQIKEISHLHPKAKLGAISKTVWSLDTNKFHKVELLTLSPNHWHGSEDGNKHYIFVLEGCKNPEKARGFYNEFLPARLNKHRKVLEVLGDKTKCEYSDKQLSGLGFSSTKEHAIVCKVSGKTNRMLKITF